MRKYLLLLILPFIFISSVKADSTNYIFPIENRLQDKPNQSAIDYIYNTLIPQYITNYNYYTILYLPYYTNRIYINFYDSVLNLSFDVNDGYVSIESEIGSTFTECHVSNDSLHELQCSDYNYSASENLLGVRYDPDAIAYYNLYDTNYNYFISEGNFEMTSFYSDNIIVESGDTLPLLKDLYEYTSFSDYVTNHDDNYVTVNLDNYEYVILSLKNYSQTDSFQTTLSVKGMIGLTPVYNYGQTSKDSTTGVQVQDRCNIAYSDYTLYPFYILQSDLQNNAVYYVKECQTGSSFKFDKNIFNITYVTQSNLSDPTITINGNTYHTIPFSDLPSSANQNEENNYIPGESGSATDIGGLDSAIKSAQSNLSQIWNVFTYFTDFVGQIFSALPSELSSILLAAFIITITLGIIKLFVGH